MVTWTSIYMVEEHRRDLLNEANQARLVQQIQGHKPRRSRFVVGHMLAGWPTGWLELKSIALDGLRAYLLELTQAGGLSRRDLN